jgi:hypothetical protein
LGWKYTISTLLAGAGEGVSTGGDTTGDSEGFCGTGGGVNGASLPQAHKNPIAKRDTNKKILLRLIGLFTFH